MIRLLAVAACIFAAASARSARAAPAPASAPARAARDPITVSAAISMTEALREAGQAYANETGAQVAFNFAASGHLLAQIKAGAPVDIFISAADRQMDEAQTLGLIEPDTRRAVATNSLVLIVPARAASPARSFEHLDDPAVQRIAIGQPRTVPAGEYATQVLEHLGIAAKLKNRLVYAASVRQVLDYVERAEVDAGIVYRTDALESGGTVKVIAAADASWHEPIRYPAALVRTSRRGASARKFLDYLSSEGGQAILARHGFGPASVPPAPRAPPAPPAKNRLWPPLMLSLRVACVATLLAAVLAVPMAFVMARRRFAGRSLLEAVLIVPLVLPPTVVGYLILITLGARSPLGRALRSMFGYSILFSWHGAVIASAVVALPLLYLPTKAAFAAVDRELEDLSRLFGANVVQIFWHVSLPLARRGIGSGLLLAFARALGEFGATVMVMGDLPGRQTLPISIYNDYVSGDLAHAGAAVAALSVISIAVILIYNRAWLERGD